MPNREQVLEALKVVNDPELGINIVDLGLVYNVDVTEDGEVHIVFTLTSAGCPIGPMIEHDMRQALSDIPGIAQITSEMVMSPPWGPDKMSEFAKSALGFF
jgi:metal-sulfur cluster biosynthetic enzyme